MTLRILMKMLQAAESNTLVSGKDDDGEPLFVLPPPALLAQAIKFLKENGIDSPATSGKKVDTLAASMPDFDQLELGSNVVSIRK